MVKDNQRNKYLKAAEIKCTREGQHFLWPRNFSSLLNASSREKLSLWSLFSQSERKHRAINLYTRFAFTHERRKTR